MVHIRDVVARWGVLFGSILGIVVPGIACASEVTYLFESRVTFGDPTFAGGIQAGDTIRGIVTFETDTIDTDPDPTHGSYDGALTAFSYTIETTSGSYSHALASQPNAIEVHADSISLSQFWIYSGISGPTTSDGLVPSFAELMLTTFSGDLFTNDSLEQSLNVSSDFQAKRFNVLFSQGFNEYWIHSDLTSLTPVPVPAAVWLFGSGVAGLMGVARRRQSAV